jgi:membrane protein DedA with SNARE-associated domain
MQRGILLSVAVLVVLYVGFALGQQYGEHPEQRRAIRVLTIVIAALAAALAWSYSLR